MTKIEIKDLSILFGPEKAKAKKMIKQGKSKQEILKETGCTIAVRNANLEIKEGEMFVIMGLSGSGKSTLVRCINRLNEPSMGEIWLSGRNITSLSDKELLQIRRKEMAMVFQHFGLLPHRTVLSNIAFGLELQGVPKEEREKKAYESIAVVGLKGYENQRVDELSGGMQQRVGLARANPTRCCIPPESSSTRWFSYPFNPTTAMLSYAFFSRSSLGTPCNSSPKAILLNTVR